MQVAKWSICEKSIDKSAIFRRICVKILRFSCKILRFAVKILRFSCESPTPSLREVARLRATSWQSIR
ncbi:hypothetical protein ACWIUD_05700 [Helicobacter sp. 23-1044]